MKVTQTKRVLRYVGNRAEPEKELFDPVEGYLRSSPLLSAIAHRDLPKLFREIPNPLFSDFEQSPDGGLFLPLKSPAEVALDMMFPVGTRWPIRSPWPWQEPKPTPPEPEFEVNLAEALVGWKRWCLVTMHLPDGGKLSLLYTMNQFVWIPDEAAAAKCDQKGCTPPAQYHNCGIYAVDTLEDARSYQDSQQSVIGQIYGWGKYVRGEEGWRAQFAYPKSFLLRSEQVTLVDDLRKYHVPIYIEKPVRIYHPSEDGYEYGQDEEDRDCRAVEEPGPEEEIR